MLVEEYGVFLSLHIFLFLLQILMNVLRLLISAPLGVVKIQKEASCVFARPGSCPMNKEQIVLVITELYMRQLLNPYS